MEHSNYAHSHAAHTEQPLRSSAVMAGIVIGMSDGLTVPLALAADLFIHLRLRQE